MHQNLDVISQHFNYGKNSFIVLIPGRGLTRSKCWIPKWCGSQSPEMFSNLLKIALSRYSKGNASTALNCQQPH